MSLLRLSCNTYSIFETPEDKSSIICLYSFTFFGNFMVLWSNINFLLLLIESFFLLIEEFSRLKDDLEFSFVSIFFDFFNFFFLYSNFFYLITIINFSYILDYIILN